MTDTPVRLGAWRVWDQFGLRGPGFPAAGVLRVVPEGLTEAADKFGPGDKLSGPHWKAFEEEFEAAAVRAAQELQRVAATDAFRAAVGWQNRPLLGRAVDPFVGWDPTSARTSSRRQREELVAHYWQRFCVKNDTIGFFGPVGWGRWDLSVDGVEIDPGAELIESAEVFYSSWAIDSLAKLLDADPAARDWIAPRRVPFVRVADGLVSLPGRPAQQASPELLAVLDRCDGTRTAHAIAAELGPDVPALLGEALGKRWIGWRLDIPADAHPERHLRAWLDQVGDPDLSADGLTALDELDAGRAKVRAAGDDPARLLAALAELEARFVARTAAAAVREKGATTAPCRTLVYSDTRRAATARLGRDVHAALAPLEMLFAGARWMTAELADAVMRRAREVFDGLTGPVDLATFWFACMPVLHVDAPAAAERIQREFQAKWAEILRVPADANRARVSTSDIEAAVRAAFPEQGTGWNLARYLSPDMMIAATPDELARGEFELVLGELHIASNTLGNSLFVNQHPAAAELFDATTVDFPEPRLMPLLPKENKSRLSIRVRHALVRPRDYYVALAEMTADPTRPRTVLSADVLVETRGDRLVVVLPDGAVFDAVDVFAHVLTTLAMDLCVVLPEAPHTPRVAIDQVVIARETWRFGADDLAFSAEKTEALRYVRARHWRTEKALPRFVFVSSPSEPRPFFVDFDSPLYVNLLAKAARRLVRTDPIGTLTVTEMLPTPDQAWLTDHEDRTYCAELRFVAVHEG
ncbi:hypothetical protein [Alloactinosynnema sp. L-07]|uniref:lantibiotic dehydratase n=1 Tax=Alloactinosynnema sp. L-07 TaxID=1653480 RepID=UPI00065EFB38|nr:lantibiotic dehydratase [Alloactinosynnema sp. L-07]CRK57292.1 hypothetical protein [Alloactinosynnema sp. L-07]